MTDRERTEHETVADPFELTDPGEYAGSLMGGIKAWLEAQRDYHTLVASQRVARVGTSLMGGSILWVLLACALAFLSAAGAIWIGRWLDDTALGLLLMGGGFLLLGLVFMLLWRSGSRDRCTLRLFNALYRG